MTYQVLLTEDAAQDLADLCAFIETQDSTQSAVRVLGKIERRMLSLQAQPARGVYPVELAALGIKDFRELFCKPYRIIYRIIEDRVYVLLITDSRRDMQTLLQRRLLS